MSCQLLKLNSSDRINASTTDPSDCTIQANQALSGSYRLRLIQLPVTYYNVNSTNSTVYFTDTGGVRTATLTSGHYASFSTLATELATKMTAAGSGTVTCAVSLLTNRLTVTNTVNFSFTFGTNTVTSASTLLGFSGNSAASATSQVGDRIMNLAETLSFNFILSDCSSQIRSAKGQGYTFIVPNMVTTPTITYFEPTAHNPITITVVNPTHSLSIKVYDDNHNIINNMRSDWLMVLEKISS